MNEYDTKTARQHRKLISVAYLQILLGISVVIFCGVAYLKFHGIYHSPDSQITTNEFRNLAEINDLILYQAMPVYSITIILLGIAILKYSKRASQ